MCNILQKNAYTAYTTMRKVPYNAHMATVKEDKTQQADAVDDHVLSGSLHDDKAEKPRPALPDAARPYMWKKGQSGNPSGRPKDVVKEIGKRISQARAGRALRPRERKLAEDLGFDVNDITMLEQIMLSLATSKHPLKVALFLERTYGKVPNININAEINTQLVMRFRSKLTDAELEDIANGANPMDILFDKLPDIDDAARLDDADIIDVDAD